MIKVPSIKNSSTHPCKTSLRRLLSAKKTSSDTQGIKAIHHHLLRTSSTQISRCRHSPMIQMRTSRVAILVDKKIKTCWVQMRRSSKGCSIPFTVQLSSRRSFIPKVNLHTWLSYRMTFKGQAWGKMLRWSSKRDLTPRQD